MGRLDPPFPSAWTGTALRKFRWYFEAWNEPNIDFWAGTPEQAPYSELYDHTARALKAVSPLRRQIG